MKKIFLLLFITFFVFSCSKTEEKPFVETPSKKQEVKVEASKNIEVAEIKTEDIKIKEEKNSNTFSGVVNIEKLQKVKDQYGIENYSGSYLTGIYLDNYDTANLDKDIAYTLSGEIYDNHIQDYSKNKDFKKEDFVQLFEKFKSGDYAGVKSDFEKNKELVPFYPTCCAGIEYVKYEVYKNGILVLEKGGNGGIGYRFTYITYKDGKIYDISKDTGFYIEANGTFNKNGNANLNLYIDNIDKGEIITEEIDKKLVGVFLGNQKYEDFHIRLDNFKNEIDSLYK